MLWNGHRHTTKLNCLLPLPIRLARAWKIVINFSQFSNDFQHILKSQFSNSLIGKVFSLNFSPKLLICVLSFKV